MKTTRTFLVIMLAACVALAGAQARPHRGRVRQPATNTQALGALQKDLEAAIQSMTAALPIYDGFRVKSIHAAHGILVAADRQLFGAKAVARPKPTVRDHVPSKNAHKRYSAQQIAQSQQNMRQGLGFLNSASKDLAAALGNRHGKGAVRLETLMQNAMNDANKSISIHGGQG